MKDKVNGDRFVLDKYEENFMDVMSKLKTSDDGKAVSKTIDNFKVILENDINLSKHIQYNELSHRIEYVDFDSKGNLIEVRSWSDGDESRYVDYLENIYGVYDEKRYQHAFRIVAESHKYHPIKDLLESKKWDGVERIDNFLKDILKCHGDTDYLREVSRMIFYGGIARIYTPGIKFDYMPVLSGKQGIGKSTIVSWLALNHLYYKEVTTIKDKEGIECIEGGWICEFSELMAFRGRENSEALKAFITRQVDRCRLSYGRFVSEFPRTCIFIGTTNEVDYLTDDTGNRRFLPLTMGLEVGELYENEKYVKDYILNCWLEALELYKNNKIYLTIPKEYLGIVKSYQDEAKVEDIKLQALENYLDGKEIGYKVCAKELVLNVFKKREVDITRADTTLISKYMSTQSNWERRNAMVLPEYGNQRFWVKVQLSDRELRKELEEDLC